MVLSRSTSSCHNDSGWASVIRAPAVGQQASRKRSRYRGAIECKLTSEAWFELLLRVQSAATDIGTSSQHNQAITRREQRIVAFLGEIRWLRASVPSHGSGILDMGVAAFCEQPLEVQVRNLRKSSAYLARMVSDVSRFRAPNTSSTLQTLCSRQQALHWQPAELAQTYSLRTTRCLVDHLQAL